MSSASLKIKIKKLILQNDPSVIAKNGKIMGEAGILFHQDGDFKYAITANSSRITLHAMPMYCNEKIHKKYSKLLPEASFGKGCIRFKTKDRLDFNLLKKFIRECCSN